MRNTGEVALAGIHVVDPRSTSCGRTIAQLAVAQSISWTCATGALSGPLTNIATVTATPQGGGPSVSATASARVLTTDVLAVTIGRNPAGGPGSGGASGSGLPFTGADISDSLLAAALLLLVGAVVVGATRRARR